MLPEIKSKTVKKGSAQFYSQIEYKFKLPGTVTSLLPSVDLDCDVVLAPVS